MVDPQPGERVLDPASGAGGFLSAAARHLVRRGAERVAVPARYDQGRGAPDAGRSS